MKSVQIYENFSLLCNFNKNTKTTCSFKNLLIATTFIFCMLFSSTNSTRNFLKEKKLIKTNHEDSVSWSQHDGAVQTKLDFDVYIDMKNHNIDGFVRFNYKCITKVNLISMDIKTIKINKVLNEQGQEIKFRIQENKNNTIGDALIVEDENICKNDTGFVDIYYTTYKETMGIHFSNPETLHNKNYTFMYTHGEAIYSRTYFPSQDTPSLKVKVSAKIRVDKPYTALFSGLLVSTKDVGEDKLEYYFEMNDPIQSYLITFAAGNMVKRTIPNSRCEVYGEEESLKYVNKSFEFCEKYIKFYEQYRNFFMKKMIFIITPDDFPFSGMENPYVTIISEDVLSHDRSYTSTISHEIAHFWSGNLVTNKNWRSFWLNEGITTYLTRKSYRHIHGEEEFNFEMFMGLNKLDKALEELRKSPQSDETQRSLTPLIKDDPYISFSRVPYEKGSFFMYHIETLVGDETMNKILSKYFTEFQFKSIDQDQFIEFMKENIKKFKTDGEEIVKKIQWEKWLKGTEKMPVEFNFTSTKLQKFKAKIDEIIKGKMTAEEFKKSLMPLRMQERGKIFKDLYEKHKKLDENTIKLLKETIKDDEIFEMHKRNKVDQILFTAAFMNDTDERINYLKKILKEFPYYKVQFLKKVFVLIIEKNSGKEFLMKILKDISSRLNPVAVARLSELIAAKAK